MPSIARTGTLVYISVERGEGSFAMSRQRESVERRKVVVSKLWSSSRFIQKMNQARLDGCHRGQRVLVSCIGGTSKNRPTEEEWAEREQRGLKRMFEDGYTDKWSRPILGLWIHLLGIAQANGREAVDSRKGSV